MTLDLGEKDLWVEDSRDRTYKKLEAEDPFFKLFPGIVQASKLFTGILSV